MISQRTQGASPVTVQGESSHTPWHQALWGCPLLLLGGLGAGNVSWFGSDKDPTAPLGTQMEHSGWVGVGAGFTESQDKLLFPSPFGPSLWFSLSSRPSGCILNHPSQHIHTPAPPSQPWAASVLFLQLLYRHEMQPQEQAIKPKFQLSTRFLVVIACWNSACSPGSEQSVRLVVSFQYCNCVWAVTVGKVCPYTEKQRQQIIFNFYSYFLMALTGNFWATILFIALWIALDFQLDKKLQHWCPVISGGFIASEPDSASVTVGARCNWD